MRFVIILALLLFAPPAAAYEVIIDLPNEHQDRIVALCEIRRAEEDPPPETWTVPICIRKLAFEIIRRYDMRARNAAAAELVQSEGADFQSDLSD